MVDLAMFGLGHWMFGLGHYWGGFWILGGLFRLAVIGAVIVGIVYAVRFGAGHSRRSPWGREDSSLEILRRRYANGEISKEEFEQKKNDLS
jgi:putative membrane protein